MKKQKPDQRDCRTMDSSRAGQAFQIAMDQESNNGGD